MALNRPPPEPAICLECGGIIPQIDVNRPPPTRNSCHCPNCAMIGPGHEPLWMPDKQNHVCQSPIDRKAIAKERRRMRNSPLGLMVKEFLAEQKKKKEEGSPA